MKQEIKAVIAESKENLPTYNWHINYTQLSDMYSIHQAGRLITIMYAENPTAKEDAELIVKAVNERKALVNDLGDAVNQIEDLKDILEQTEFSKKKLEDERKALLDSHRELLNVLEGIYTQIDTQLLQHKFDDIIGKIKTAINNAKNI